MKCKLKVIKGHYCCCIFKGRTPLWLFPFGCAYCWLVERLP